MLETNIIAFLYLAAHGVAVICAFYEYEIPFERPCFIGFMTGIFLFDLRCLFTCPDMINLHGRTASLCLGLFSLVAFDGYLEEKMEIRDDDDEIW